MPNVGQRFQPLKMLSFALKLKIYLKDNWSAPWDFLIFVSKDLETLQKQSKCNSKRFGKTSQKIESRIHRSKDSRWNFILLFTPALSLLFSIGILPTLDPPNWLPSQHPRAFFAFGFEVLPTPTRKCWPPRVQPTKRKPLRFSNYKLRLLRTLPS